MIVGVAAAWDNNGVLVGVGMGTDAGEGVKPPSAYQLLAGALILEGEVDAAEVQVPGKRLEILWPNVPDVNDAQVEVGTDVSEMERRVMAEVLRFIADVQMHGSMIEQARRQQQIVTPGQMGGPRMPFQ